MLTHMVTQLVAIITLSSLGASSIQAARVKATAQICYCTGPSAPSIEQRRYRSGHAALIHTRTQVPAFATERYRWPDTLTSAQKAKKVKKSSCTIPKREEQHGAVKA